jgi:hypothetical protein
MMSDINITTDGIEIKNSDGTWTKLGIATNVSVDAADAMIYSINERSENMDIVNLYEKRMEEKIEKDYEALVNDEYENLDVVKEYNELINTFKINLEQLANKYNTNEATYLYKTGYCIDFPYELAGDIKSKIELRHLPFKTDERKDLHELVEEVKAQLSLSNDKDFQIEVLKNYEILDKKGKLNI